VDGLEVLQAIREDECTKLVPVVVLTSSTEQRDLVESYRLGINTYIQKPVDFEQFHQLVQQLGLYWLVAGSAYRGLNPWGAAKTFDQIDAPPN
jgi:two-component system, response regulator